MLSAVRMIYRYRHGMYYFLARPPSLAYRRALVECTRQYTAVPPQAVTREKKKEILCTPTTLRPTRLLCAHTSLARRRSCWLHTAVHSSSTLLLLH